MKKNSFEVEKLEIRATALHIEGTRRIGKSFIAEEFTRSIVLR